MKPTLSFYVSGDPKGQPRPRAFARKFGDKWSARVYDAGTAEGWKGLVAAECKLHLPPDFTPYDGPVSVRMCFNLRRPKAHFLKSGMRPGAPRWCLNKHDADNLAKAVLDCFTQIGIWRDDSQVCDLHISKEFAVGNSNGCSITINELAP